MKKKQLNAKQEAKLNSYHSIEQHVDENISVINAIAAFLATYNKIKANIAAIFEFEQEKSALLTGIASGKTSLRESLSKFTVTIAGLIYTYAEDISDHQMREEMNISLTTLKRMRDDELAPFCQFVHDRAAAHANALKDYNVTSAKLDQLQTLIADYRAEAPKPRTAISGRKITNANIAAVFKETDKLFDRFDKQIESLRDDHPDFVNTYFSTREIVDPPTRSRKPLNTIGSNQSVNH